jgi:hypothetical protein
LSFEVTFKGDASLKNRFPFRLGTTSYVIPADLKTNVAFLADTVEDGNDHRSLAFLPAGLLTTLVKRLGGRLGKTRVLTMEIFDEEALSQSLDLLRRL